MKWAVAITTIPSRRTTTFPKTLDSLRSSGFDNPRIFVDAEKDGASWEREFKVEVSVRGDRILPYGNWILALIETYIRNPLCERYAIFQDDLICSRNIKTYLDSCQYPKRQRPLEPHEGKGLGADETGGYWNLYSWPVYEAQMFLRKGPNYIGWYETGEPNHPQRGLGALALVFSRDMLWKLLSHWHIIKKPGGVDERRFKNIDGAVVEAANQMGSREFCHSPSLVQHIGLRSSIEEETPICRTPHKKSKCSRTFRGEEFDLMELLKR